jgi:hypothetical protein
VIANAFIVTFVSSFIAIAVFGHVLLIAAVWPDLLGKRRKAQHDPAAESISLADQGAEASRS